MKCPACRSAMLVLELDKIEIDHCSACGGIWLDRGELVLLLDPQTDPSAIFAQNEENKTASKPLRKCPICDQKMTHVFYQGSNKIEIDQCVRQDGLWFDRGELEAVLQLSEPENKAFRHLQGLFRKA